MMKVGEMELRNGKTMEIYDDDSETESEEEFDDDDEHCFYCECEINMTERGGFLDAETGEVYCEHCYEAIEINK